MSDSFDELLAKNTQSEKAAKPPRDKLTLFLLVALACTVLWLAWGYVSNKKPTETPALTTERATKPQATEQAQPQTPLATAEQAVAKAKEAAQSQAVTPQTQSQVAANAEVKSSGLTICSGPVGGAFEKVVADINSLGMNLNVLPTTGAGDNLTFLHNGKCQYALVNSDDYWVRKNVGNDDRIVNTRTVVALFEGVVHMLATKPEIVRFSQTENLRVGVTGGAVATFELIQKKTGMTFDVVAYNSTGDLTKALAEGSVDMIVMAGAKPQPWLQKLSLAGLHFVEFDKFDKMADLMTREEKDSKGVIRTVGFLGKRPVGKADYPNVSGTVVQLTTRTVLATSKDAESDTKVEAKTKEIFKAVSNNLSELRKGGHQSWKSVATMNDPGGISWASVR